MTPVDTRLPLLAAQGSQVNLADIFMNAQRVKSMQQDRERQAWDWQQKRDETQRKGETRMKLADLLLAQDSNMPGAPQGPQDGPVVATSHASDETGAVQPDTTSTWRDYVRLDPEGAIDFRASTTDWRKDQFEVASKLNEGVLQILGGVYDQQSYERGKNKARALYGRIGIPFEDLNLPDEYSPELVRSLQMEAMDTRHQLDTLRKERKTNWDIEDDQIDNDRLAAAEADRAHDRKQRRAETRR